MSDIAQQIRDLMKAHNIYGLYMGGASDACVKDEKDRWVLEFGDLPQLSFFMELAELCDVPLTSIHTDSSDSGPGCDTCGYGAGTEITVTVPKKKS